MSSFPNARFLLSLEKDLLKTSEIKDIRVITDRAPSKRNVENLWLLKLLIFQILK